MTPRLPRFGRHAHDAHEPTHHELAEERAPRPIWLPQLHEGVTLVWSSGETLPAKIVDRSADSLQAVVIVPLSSTPPDLTALTLEYANPGGRVRLAGRTQVEPSEEGLLVTIEDTRLIEVVQQRAHIRVRAECPLTLVSPESGEVRLTQTDDVSAGGLLVAEANVASVGDELKFEVTITPGQAPVTGTATVARIDERGRCGLYFTEIAPFDRWRLIRFTLEVQESEHAPHPSDPSDT